MKIHCMIKRYVRYWSDDNVSQSIKAYFITPVNTFHLHLLIKYDKCNCIEN